MDSSGIKGTQKFKEVGCTHHPTSLLMKASICEDLVKHLFELALGHVYLGL